MMVLGHIGCELHKLPIGYVVQDFTDYPAAGGRMLLHLLVLFIRQPCRFLEDRVGNNDLADVMHRSKHSQKGYEVVVQLIGIDSVLETEPGQGLDVGAGTEDMLSGLHVTAFNKVGKGGNDVLLHPGHLLLVAYQFLLDVLLDEVVVVDVADGGAYGYCHIGDVDFVERHRDDSGNQDHQDHDDGHQVPALETLSHYDHVDDQVQEAYEVADLVDDEKLAAEVAFGIEVEYSAGRRQGDFHGQVQYQEDYGNLALVPHSEGTAEEDRQHR